MKPTILYICPSWFTLRYHLEGQLDYLRSNGFEVEVVSEADPRAAEAASREGVAYWPIDIRDSVAPIEDLRAFRGVVEIVGERKYDIINCSTKKGGLLCGLAARITRVPWVVYVVRGIVKDRTTRWKRWMFPVIEKMICRNVDRVIFMGKSNMDVFREKGWCPPEKQVILGGGSLNGVDTKCFAKTDISMLQGVTLRRRCGISSEACVLGFVGRLVREKGIAELAAAWQTLQEGHENLHLLIVAPPETDPLIEPSLAALREDPRVHFLGFMADTVQAYAAMDCLILPSYSEGLGTVLIEAAAMELPVIASRTLGCIDVVINDQTGLLVAPRDSVALAQAIERVLSNRERALEWGANGRRRCLELFDRQIIWKTLAEFYLNLLANRRNNRNLR